MKEDYKDFTINIIQDDQPESPREGDNLGKMICWHRNYNLGDFTSKDIPWDSPQDFIESLPKGYVILPLYLYEHSGITMSTGSFSDPWDSGQVGYIYADVEAIQKWFNVKRITKKIRERVIEVLKFEVKIYAQFLEGDVWGYSIEDNEGDDAFDMNSCWGFYGTDTALIEAQGAIDWYIQHEKPKAKDKSILHRI